MLTFGARRTLPRPRRPARSRPTAEVAEVVRGPARAGPRAPGATGWSSSLYAADAPRGRRGRAALVPRVRARRASTSSTCCGPTAAAGSRVLGAAPGSRRAGVPYDVRRHPFAAQAVLDGRVTHATRDELAATLRADPDRVAAVAAASRREPPGTRTRPAARGRAGVRPRPGARGRVDRRRPCPTTPTLAAAPGGACRESTVRDAAWMRDDPRRRRRPRRALDRRACAGLPTELLAAPAALLGVRGLARRATARWPGARSTGAASPTRTTGWPGWWPSARPRGAALGLREVPTIGAEDHAPEHSSS